jgi:hypothetical protein
VELIGGEMLGGYRLIERIGRGGMAEVWRAYQASLSRYVAIKVLPSFLATDSTYDERFKREALLVSRLRHPNILTIFDFGQQDGNGYMVSELVEGGTLADQVGAPLPVRYVASTLRPIAGALDYAHARGVIHRDVKPSNILLQPDGTPILADFGVAGMLHGNSRLTGEKMTVGTPIYMSPEQVAGLPLSPSRDLYALGVVAYEMLTGQPPFTADTPLAVALAHLHKPLPPPRSINPNLPSSVEAVLLKALAKDPAERFPSAHDFVDALDLAAAASAEEPGARTAAAATTPVAVAAIRRPPSAGPAGGSPSVGRRLGVAALGLLVLALVAFAAPALLGRPWADAPAPKPGVGPRIPDPENRLAPAWRSQAMLQGHADGIWDLAFSPDGKRLLSTSHQNPRALVWDLGKLAEAQRYAGHPAAVVAAAWSPGQFPNLVATGGFDGTIRLWDAATGQDTSPPLSGHGGPIWSLGWERSGRQLASGSADGTVRIWSPGSGRPAEVIETEHGTAFAVAWSPSEQFPYLLAGGLQDGSVAIWDSLKRQVWARVPGHSKAALAVAWSPDGALLASGSEDGTVRIWEQRGQRAEQWAGHTAAVWSVAWSEDGTTLASGSDDGLVKFWRRLGDRWELSGEIASRGAPVFALAWARDDQGALLAVGRQDRQVELLRPGERLSRN